MSMHASGTLIGVGSTVLSVCDTKSLHLCRIDDGQGHRCCRRLARSARHGRQESELQAARLALRPTGVLDDHHTFICNARGRANGERSRSNSQRYWGEPFPIVFPDGSDQAVPLREGARDPQVPRFTSARLSPPISFLAEDLPVILPPTDNFRCVNGHLARVLHDLDADGWKFARHPQT